MFFMNLACIEVIYIVNEKAFITGVENLEKCVEKQDAFAAFFTHTFELFCMLVVNTFAFIVLLLKRT